MERKNFGPFTHFGMDAALCFIGWVRPNPVPPVLALIICIDTHKLGQFVHKLGSIIILIGLVWLCWECLQSATVLWDSTERELLPLKRLELLWDPWGRHSPTETQTKPKKLRRRGEESWCDLLFLWNAGFCSLLPKNHILSSPWCTKQREEAGKTTPWGVCKPNKEQETQTPCALLYQIYVKKQVILTKTRATPPYLFQFHLNCNRGRNGCWDQGGIIRVTWWSLS